MAIARLIVASILGAGLFLAAVISIQNVQPVTLTFLTFQSIKIPFGVLLVGGVAVGLIGGAAISVALQGSSSKKRLPSPPPYVRNSRPRS